MSSTTSPSPAVHLSSSETKLARRLVPYIICSVGLAVNEGPRKKAQELHDESVLSTPLETEQKSNAPMAQVNPANEGNTSGSNPIVVYDNDDEIENEKDSGDEVDRTGKEAHHSERCVDVSENGDGDVGGNLATSANGFPVGQCCIGDLCQHPGLELRNEHKCITCNKIVHTLCAVFDHETDGYECKVCYNK